MFDIFFYANETVLSAGAAEPTNEMIGIVAPTTLAAFDAFVVINGERPGRYMVGDHYDFSAPHRVDTFYVS